MSPKCFQKYTAIIQHVKDKSLRFTTEISVVVILCVISFPFPYIMKDD